MRNPRRTLWWSWGVALVVLALMAAAPRIVAPDPTPYSDAGTSVLAFVLTLLAMTAGVGSLAVREALLRDVWAGVVDPQSDPGSDRVLRELLGAWTLCLIVAGLGALLSWLSAKPALAWPYVLAASALLAFHAPRASAFGKRAATPARERRT